jgi:hypothetical protein
LLFTSCEEVLHPELKGKPIITGAERGIVACASYAAKKIGIKRGVNLRIDKVSTLYEAMDEISQRFGKHALHLGGSHVIEVSGKGKRGESTVRENTQFFGETKSQHLGLPILHVKV